MPSIEFIIKANYKEVDKAIKKIEDLKKIISSMKDTDPGMEKLEQGLKKAQDEISKYADEIAQLKAILHSIEKSEELIDNTRRTTQSTNEATNTFVKYIGTLDELNQKIKQLNKEYSSLSEAQRTSIKGQNLIQEIASLNAQRDIEQNKLRSLRREYVNTQKVQDSQEGSISALRAQLSLLTTQYDSLGRAMRKGAEGQELLKSIKTISTELSEAEQASMRFQRNVGNYASGFNGLSNSVQQVARELPSLAISANTFFLAISNNLPILADEISKARKQYNDYMQAIKSGAKDVQKVAPVWKQVATSIFSWQSALVLGITLLSVYGKDVIDFTTKLFSFSSSIDKVKIALDDFNSSMSMGRINAQDELVTLELLYNAATDNANSLNERKKAVKKLKSEYPEYLKNMSDEDIMAGNASKTYDLLSKSILKTAQARATYDRIVENNKKILEINEELKKSIDPNKGFWGWADKNIPYLSKNFTLLALRVKYAGNNVKDLLDQRDALTDSNKKLAEGLNVSDLFKEDNKDNKKELNIQKKLNDSIIDNELRLNAERIALMNEGRKKRLALSQQEWEERKVQLDKEYQDTVAQYKEIGQQTPKEVQTTYKARLEINDKEKELRDKEIYDNAKKEFAERQKALTDVLMTEEERRLSPIKDRYEKERKWAKENLDAEYINQDEYEQYLKKVDAAEQQELVDLLKKTLDKYKDYATQRLEVEKKLNDDIKFLESQRTEENYQQIDAAIAEAKKQTEKQMSNISFAEFKDSDLWSKMFSDLEKMALPTLQNILEQAKKVNTEGFSPEQIKEYQDALERLEDSIRNRSPFKSIQNDWEKLMKAFKEGSKEDITSALSGIDKAVQKINSDLETLAGGISNIFGDEAGYAATQIAELTGAIGNFATGAASIASGDILGGITSVISGIGSIFSMGKRAKEMNAAARAEQQKFYDEVHKGEVEYQALLRERARLEQQLGETSISYNSRITAELDKQRKTIDAQVNTLMKQLQQESYISGVGYKHGTWFRKAKTWNEYESLMGKTYDEIEALYMSNKLDGKAKELFEELQKLKEEGAEIDQMLVDQAEAFREYLSGMTFDSLKESIKSAFEDGKFDIQDAADFTKQVFKKAILQALEAKVLEKALQPFLESFQSDAEAGTLFEPGKMDYYQEWIKRIGEEGNAFMDNIMKLPEIANIFNNEATRSAQAKGIASISQDTGDKLDGKATAGLIYLDKMTTSSYDIAGSIKDLTRQSYDGWKNVEAIKELSSDIKNINNRIADNTEDIGAILKTIRSDTKGMNEDVSYVRTNGLYVKR